MALLTSLGGLLPAGLRQPGMRGFATASELSAATGLRCAGTLPQRSCSADARGCPAGFEAAAREIASRLGLLRAGQEGRVVLVTSALPREGRSILCQALGEVLLAAGQRVLLLDARASGTALQPSAERSGADALPCLVAVRDRPVFSAVSDAECIGEFAQFLDDARLHFNLILVTGAPIMQTMDSLVLGGMSDLIVTVTRQVRTPRSVVKTALRRLEEHALVVEAVVLNGMESR